MSEFFDFGKKLREILTGLLLGEERTRSARHGTVPGELSAEELAEARARSLRMDPARIPGSLHFAAVLAYGDFILADGGTIRCEGIPGISGVASSSDVQREEGGAARVHLDRVLTHFHFNQPAVLIEQNNAKRSTGTLIGVSRGEGAVLLPGRASFSQYLHLTLDGRPLANREPLVMTADRVDQWPPIGSTFVSEGPTDFFDLQDLENPVARPVATLAACKAATIQDLSIPELVPHE